MPPRSAKAKTSDMQRLASGASRPFAPLGACFLSAYLVLGGCTGASTTGDDDACCGGEGGASGGEGGASGGEGGEGGEGGGGPVIPPEEATGFACAPTASPVETDMRRLSAVQFRNTIRDLVDRVAGNKGQTIFAAPAVAEALARYPLDERQPVPKDKHGAYRKMDQAVSDLHVEAAYRVAFAVAAELAKTDLRADVLGSCATDSNAGNDADCITQFVKKLGALAFRRPLADNEMTFFRGFYGQASGIDAGALAETIAGMLMAPRFLYIVENGADAADGRKDVYELDAYEVASRLSYQFWQTMPDAELFAAAADGSLREAEGFRKQVDRLLRDPRAEATFDEFYTDYLKLDDLPFIDKKEEFKYRSFAGPDLPGPNTRANVIADIVDMTRYITWKANGRFDDLLLDEHVFAKTDDVAALYKVNKWSGSGEPPKFPAGTRPGVLTRVGLLATGMVVTRPIMKGVFIRQNLLCDFIPPPPDNAQNATIAQGLATTRLMTERVTEQKGSSCASCHSSLINPLGFAYEGFDSLGRARTEEIFYNGDTGLETKRFAVNTKVVPQVTDDDKTEATGPKDLAKLIVDSGKAHACFARHLLRFTYGRWEQLDDEDKPTPADGCMLESVRKAVEEKTLADALREIALSPHFTLRTMRP